MSLESFKESSKGAKLARLFAAEEVVEQMIRKSRAGRPAVEAIGRDIEAQVGALDDAEKKLVGRWAREVLAPRGWVPHRKGRVARGHFFSRGTIYRPVRPAHAKGDGAARLAAAQALVVRFSHPAAGADALIEERRRAFEAGE
jgi:hypothetical protein